MALSRTRTVSDALSRVVAQLPGGAGEVRTGQLAMAEAAAATLARPTGVLAVAAGTGTGKSFAYLVPAALSGKRVVVATATKALQDQLASKDLPLVAKGLGTSVRTPDGKAFSWAVLKGRSNYLCRQRLDELEEFGRQESLVPAVAGALPPRRPATGSLETTGEQVARLVKWSERTATGDRAELDFEPQSQAWSNVSVTADECPGAHRCASGAGCFAEKARARAAAAHVVIVNLHLLGADLRSGGLVIPEHDALVVDEAHELEDVMAASLGVDVTPGRLRGIAAAARAALAASAPKGERAARRETAVEDVFGAATRFESSLADAADRRLPNGLGDGVGTAVRLAVTRIERLESELRSLAGDGSSGGGSSGGGSRGHGGTGDGSTGDGSKGPGADASLRALLALERCREELSRCLEAGSEEVLWVAGGDRVALRSAPLDVRGLLAAEVFEQIPVVLTSATMAPGLALRVGGAAHEITDLDVGSPFDYRSHGLLYCATRLPDRRTSAAQAAIHDEIEHLVRAAGGRTLALFTSRRAMDAAAAELRVRVELPIHVQGELPKAALLQRFSGEEASCLFATMGFWQGVDVPGPSLSLVVIDRLPFPRPDDPLMSARREAAGSGGFRLVDLPRAATLLAQGAGRLIRSASDRGVVAVLDPRLATATYSGYLVKALPNMRRTRDRDEAVAFLRALTG